MKIILTLPVLLLFSSVAAEDDDYFKNEILESCYSKPVTAAVPNCMIYLADQKKTEYENQFKSLLKKVELRKDDFHNYKDFVQHLRKSKDQWDSFIGEECITEAYLDEYDSFAFHTDKNACTIKGYSERINYYANYQFE
ncbi:hypothetical protein LU631_16625 [Erwinia tracheiphila]|uniref:DUF1311 domain-containing protein n=1 Tax=Erwinia tracheiphila TaxID=65700 RepID=A0A0M2KC87_9GAMM|nr:hypothetical protein [Erwinia tracheiphila]EOS96626.1 hypothetical protein ETR_01796 [Erwinia tracheiphila PSU-1]KKF34892.1 hypothetical protein SY86_04730 [Erwinia tracheiphila]UIA86555.1 hypothetical protein LU631_16625 [Erwinia tracheiphila]UIA94908.1 hypothetical protein LU633_15085 [Erwinia tracheiphila]